MRNTIKNRIKARKDEKDYLVIGNMNCILNDILAELKKIESAFGYTQEQSGKELFAVNKNEQDFTEEYTDENGDLIRKNSKGQLHSLYSPAAEYANGNKYWYLNGKLHREDGPAVEYSNGDKRWYQNGKRHRENGPAVERVTGYKAWYKDGKYHREDGPAIEFANGDEHWFLNDKFYGKDTNGYTQEQFEEDLRRNGITSSQKLSFNFDTIEDDYTEEYIDENGDLIRKNSKGQFHSLYSPAIEYTDGTKRWYQNGKRHRENGPAVEDFNGDKVWYLNDKLHREDGPAVEYSNGDKHWYLNDKLHREDGPAIEYSDGDKRWYQNGQRHREDGPAIEDVDGDKAWYKDGKLHREDGAAIECSNGDKFWYVNDEKYGDSDRGYTQEKFEKDLRKEKNETNE